MEKQYKLYTDGSHLTLDNIAGYGGYIEDNIGNTILEFSELIEDEELFAKHERVGLKRGLELCLERGIKNLHCYTDEQVLAQTGNIKNEATKDAYFNTPLLKEIRKLIEKFETIEFTYIPRELNSKADKLSRREILKAKKQLIEQYPQDNKFMHSKLDSSSNYKNKDKFIALNKTFTDYIVVNGTHGTDQMKTYYAKKDLDTGNIEVEVLEEIECYNKTKYQILDALVRALKKKTDLKECVIACYGGSGPDIEQIMRGRVVIPKSLGKSFQEFSEVIEQFDKVTYHLDDNIIAATVKPIKKVTKQELPDKLFEAIKKLGDDNYVLGSDIEIENLIPMRDSKKNNINEMQKLYFSEFLKLQIKQVTKAKERLHHTERNMLVAKKIQEVRDNFNQQGIKLRM